MARTGTSRPGLSCPEHDPGQPGPARPGPNRHCSGSCHESCVCVGGGSSIERQWHLLFNWLHAPCKTGVAGCRVLQGRPRPHSLACRCSAACRVETMQRIAYSAPLHSGGPGSRRRGRAGEMRRRGPGRVDTRSSRKVVVRPGPALDRPYLAPAGHGPARLRKHHHHINTPLPGTRSWAGPCPDRTGSD